jgi:hypothetical protein
MTDGAAHRWRETAADLAVLRGWRRDGRLPAGTATDVAPEAGQWRGFLDALALWLGVALCAAAAVCFIAANWDAMGRFARLGLMEVALVAATLAAWRLGLARPAGQAALALATVLLGGLLAVVGQTYQTGADTWELFALWTALTLPWTLAARNTAQWLGWALLLNLAVGLRLGLRTTDLWLPEAGVALPLGLLDLALAAIWAGVARWRPDLAGPLGARLLVVAAMGLLTWSAMLHIVEATRDTPFAIRALAVTAWGLATLVVGAVALRGRRDVPLLAMLMLGAIGVITCALGKALLEGNPSSGLYLVMGLAVLAQATIAVIALRRLARGAGA